MPEIKREPIFLEEIAGVDYGPFVVFDDNHAHMDILRYVISDVGIEHVEALLNVLREQSEPAPGAA